MYTVYKITNKVNNKFYIGVHKTNNPYDNYMGSGTAIKNAIKKHSKENFAKEILFITEDKQEAYNKEAELTEDFNCNSNYNMRRGGIGGFTIENARKGNAASLAKLTKEQLSKNGKLGYIAANINPVESGRKGGLANKGKPKSEEHKQRLRDIWKSKTLDQHMIEKIHQIKILKQSGLSSKKIGDIVGLHRNTVMKYWK